MSHGHIASKTTVTSAYCNKWVIIDAIMNNSDAWVISGVYPSLSGAPCSPFIHTEPWTPHRISDRKHLSSLHTLYLLCSPPHQIISPPSPPSEKTPSFEGLVPKSPPFIGSSNVLTISLTFHCNPLPLPLEQKDPKGKSPSYPHTPTYDLLCMSWDD